MALTRREPGDYVRLLEADPDLGGELSKERLEELTPDSWVTTWTLTPGEWPGADDIPASSALLYVITGTLARRFEVEGQPCLELWGPGQLLPHARIDPHASVPTEVSWQVLAQSWVAVIDSPFLRHVSPSHEIITELIHRAELRAHSLSFRLALVGIRNLEKRLLLLLWHLADSYGHVVRGGVAIDLVLSHDVLAQLISARRQSVTRSLKALAASGYVSRAGDRTFVLRGSGPPERVVLANE